MFSKIIKSEARKGILLLLLQNSRQKYYLRELASMINYSAGSLQRELNSLVESGFILSEKMGNLRFFSLNQKSPFLKELKVYLAQQEARNTGEMQQVVIKKSPEKPKKSSRSTSVLDNKPEIDYAKISQEISKKSELPSQPSTHVSSPAIAEKEPELHVEMVVQPVEQVKPAQPESPVVFVPPISIPPNPPQIPATPFSYIEPPTFSKPVLHKPYLEKPNLSPVPQGTSQYSEFADFHVIDPKVPEPAPYMKRPGDPSGQEIEIHIE